MQNFDSKLNAIEALKSKKLSTLELADVIRTLKESSDLSKAEQNIVNKEIIKMLIYKIRRPFTAFRKQLIMDPTICTSSALHLRFVLSFYEADDAIITVLDDSFKNAMATALEAVKALDETEFLPNVKPCSKVARLPISTVSESLSISEFLEIFDSTVIQHSAIII